MKRTEQVNLRSKKILVIISSDLYVRNYLTTDVFSEIDTSNYELFFIGESSIENKHILEEKNNFLGYFGLNPKTYHNHKELLNIYAWRYRKKSSTFPFRFLILYWPSTSKYHQRNKMNNPFVKLWNYIKALKYPLFGNAIISKISVPFMKSKIKINEDLKRFIQQIEPDLVILPSSAYDPVGTDISSIGPQMGFKTLILIDNWDNLSSKSILWEKPDYLAVWGDQTKEHAIDIHGMNPERVIPIGTPRFESYFASPKKKHPSPYDFNYILFCGCSEPFDELTALKILDMEITQNKTVYGNMKVVYRPHPRRHDRLCEDYFQDHMFTHVVLDKQIRKEYYNPTLTSQPGLDYYPSLLFNSTLTIAPLTTMVMEALICGKEVIAIIYDDNTHFTSPHNTYKYFHHFKGVERINGLFFCDDKSGLGRLARDRIKCEHKCSRKEILSSLRYFLYFDTLTYSQRLKNLIDRVVSE